MFEVEIIQLEKIKGKNTGPRSPKIKVPYPTLEKALEGFKKLREYYKGPKTGLPVAYITNIEEKKIILWARRGHSEFAD